MYDVYWSVYWLVGVYMMYILVRVMYIGPWDVYWSVGCILVRERQIVGKITPRCRRHILHSPFNGNTAHRICSKNCFKQIPFSGLQNVSKHMIHVRGQAKQEFRVFFFLPEALPLDLK